jgi:integrase/recombinase XerD
MDKIHNYKKRLERTLERIKNSEEISKTNKDLILRFHNYCFSEGVGCAKTERYVYDAFTFAKWIKKDLDTLNKNELQEFVAKLEMNEWSPNTKHCFKIMIRKFYRYVEGITEKGIYPERVRWLKSNVKNCQRKLPSELLNEDEIERMINSTGNNRDKALISVLYETGCRIGEVGHLCIKEIEFDENGTSFPFWDTFRLYSSNFNNAEMVPLSILFA